LPARTRITDYISLGVISKTFPQEKVKQIIGEAGKAASATGDLPVHVVLYYVFEKAIKILK